MQNMNKTQQGQSFLDVVLQQTGSFEATISAAIINDISITDSISIGSEVKVKNVSADIFLQFKNKRPATAVNISTADENKKGIGYMQIGSTFIVK